LQRKSSEPIYNFAEMRTGNQRVEPYCLTFEKFELRRDRKPDDQVTALTAVDNYLT